MKRRHFLAAALTAPMIAHAESRRVLKFIPQSDLATLDPMFTTASVTRYHAHLMFDTLYGMDNNYQAQPRMAAGHVVSSDGLQWDITLRDGLLFHDGSKVLVRDAVASIRRWWQRDAFGLFVPGTPMANDAGLDTLKAPKDVPALRKALHNAGYNGERIVVLAAVDSPTQNALALVDAETHLGIGFNVDLQATDWGTVQQRRASKAHFFTNPSYTPLGLFFQPTAYQSSLTGIRNGLPQFYGVRRA